MNVTLDADILFNAVSGHSTKTLLHHIVNAGHSLFVPLTVLGEVMLVSMSDDKKYEAMQDIVFLCRELSINFQIPSQKLRQCCVCIDDVDKHNRLQFTDKTHLGYAAASASDYFLTTDKLLRRFRYPCETVGGCGSAPICISPDDMRELL
jgi:predicted nucleic acid-binding protein